MESKHEQLLSEVKAAINETVDEKKIGIAFSGGIDSTLLAKICSDLGFNITLLTIGFPNSHDIEFAKQVNTHLNFKHEIFEINQESFDQVHLIISKKINTKNLSWIENSIAFYYVAKLASSLSLKTVVTANGIDELFCGYNRYRDAFVENKILEFMNSKLENELKMMITVNDVTSEFSVKILQPFLSNKFINYAKTIPIPEKISGKDDMLRKHIVRNLGSEIGLPEISTTKRKKALQYGSFIHKALIKSR